MKRLLLLLSIPLALAACGTTKAESPLGKAADRVIDEIIGTPATAANGAAPVKTAAGKS